MSADQTAEIMRHLMAEAFLISSPLLFGAAAVSLIFSLLQTVTGIQEQTLTAVPRLVVVFVISFVVLPWSIQRLIGFTLQLWTGLSRYLG